MSNTPSVEFYETERDAEHFGQQVVEPEWRWRLKAGNGEIVASGEGHTTKTDAQRAFREMALALMALMAYGLEFAVRRDALSGQAPG